MLRRALGQRGAARSEAARRIGLREVRPDDTFIASFPRSGNTWVRFLIATLRHPGEEISFRNIERFVPDIHKSRGSLHAMPSPRYIKSHTPCFDAFPRLVYVVRDGRDAMISYYHYAVGEGSFSGSLSEFVSSPAAFRYGTWGSHVLGGVAAAERDPERALLVRYEDLIASPVDQVLRIARFCGLDPEPGVAREAADRCRFSQLREIERRRGGEREAGVDVRFFRRGVAGQWRGATNLRELAPFLEEAGEALSRLGYPA